MNLIYNEDIIVFQEWLDVWGLLVGEAKKISDLPMWLQYYPKTLFDTINRSGSGVITKNELRWKFESGKFGTFTSFLAVYSTQHFLMLELLEKRRSGVLPRNPSPP